jgi:hypothetical protein
MSETDNGWRTDFDAPDIRDRPIIVYATDDDGYAYGQAVLVDDEWCWLATGGVGRRPRPLNDGIERALCWKHIDYPGLEFLDRLAEGLRNPPIPHQENT